VGALAAEHARDDTRVVDDIDLAGGYPAEDVIRRVGQLG
jgi:hypothetical protein